LAEGREPRDPAEVLLSAKEMQARSAVGRRMAEAQALLRELKGLAPGDAEGPVATRNATLREWAINEIGRAAQDWVRFGGDVRLILPPEALASSMGTLTSGTWPAAPAPPGTAPLGGGSAGSDSLASDGGVALGVITRTLKVDPALGRGIEGFPAEGADPVSADLTPREPFSPSQIKPLPPPAATPKVPRDASSSQIRIATEAKSAEVKALVDGVSPTRSKWSRTSGDELMRIDPNALAGLGDLVAEAPLPSPEQMDKVTVRKELDLLLAVTADTSIVRWTVLPQKVQRALVGYFACRARRIQDEEGAAVRAAGLEDKLDPVFSRLSAYSKRHQPGWVKGLSFGHTPERASWYEDGVAWWNELQRAFDLPDEPKKQPLSPEKLLQKVEKRVLDSPAPGEGVDSTPVLQAFREAVDGGLKADDPRLVRLAMPFIDALTAAGSAHKDIRKAVRRAQDADVEAAADLTGEVAAAAEIGPPPEWAWWPLVRGKRAVIVGGDRREEARKRLQDTFELSECEWVPLQHENQALRSLAASVTGGGVDLVLILRRFVPHMADEILIPACKAAGVPWVSVERGYGVERVRQGIERYLRLAAQPT